MYMLSRGLATALLAVGLSSCGGPYDTAITTIDETAFGGEGERDALAAIQISDPTLYSREALVNDRRRERAYLAEVLEGSKTVEFQSEIRRELLSIFALSARLGVAFDPAARLDFLRQERQADATSDLNLRRTRIAGQQLGAQNRFELERLRQNREINRLIEAGRTDEAEAVIRQRQIAEQSNLVRLRSELELYQAQLREQRRQIEAYEEAVREGRPVDATPGDPAGDPDGSDQPPVAIEGLPSLPDTPLAGAANDIGSLPDRGDSQLSLSGNPQLASVPNARDIRIETPGAELDAMFERLDSQVDRLTGLLDKQITTARDVDTTLSPEDEFQARQAYRQTIRSALAENDLDDLHDLDGNSLYRFQFRATILPGEKKNKFGVAKFDIRSPKVDRKAVSDLYNSWLGHATYRMNARESSKNSVNRGNVGDNTYELLAAGTGLFEISRFAFHPSYGDLSAFDPCRHARGPRQQEALGCEVLAIAVPPGARGLVDAGLANFQDTLLRAVVRALQVEVIKTDAAKADLRMKIDGLDSDIRRKIEKRDELKRNMKEGEKRNTAPAPDGQPPSMESPSGDATQTSEAVSSLDTEINELSEERKRKSAKLAAALSQAFKDYLGEVGKTPKTENSCVARLPEAGDNSLGLKRTPRLTDLVEVIIKAAGVDTMSPGRKVDGETANLTYLRMEFEAATKGTRGGAPINTAKAPAVLSQYQELAAKLEANPDGADQIRADMRRIQNDVMANALAVLNGLTLTQLRSLLHPRLALTLAAEFLNASPAIAKSAEGTVRRYDLDREQQAKLNALLDQFESGAQSARDFLRFFFSYHEISSCEHVVASKRQEIDAKLTLHTEVPTRFCEALFVDRNAAAGLCAGTSSESGELDGDGYAYTTQPVERSQRVSTIASAAEAYEFALALALQAPQAALGLNGGLGASRLATGKVQARENVPLVVGFSNSGGSVGSNGSFGWVFGPRFQLDPSANELKLVQHVKPYDVTADLSVPGWWPHVDLALNTVWNGNWHDGEKLIDAATGGQRIVRVPLRNNRADMDGLTNHVSKRLLGRSLQATHVSRVVPHTLSRCVDNASLLVFGSNIWRSTEVFLNGVKASDDTIKVLPDMEGISVGFPSSAYRVASSADGGRARLTVWTRDGFDEYLLPLSGDHTKSPCTDVASSSPPSHQLTAILPNTVSVCSSTTDFIVTVMGMTKAEEKDIAVTFAGDRVAPYEVADFAGGKGVRIRFQGKHQAGKWNGLNAVKVAVASKKGLVTGDVSLVGDLSKCGKAPKADVAASISSVVTSAGTDRIEVCQPSTLVAVAGKNLKGVTLGEWLSKREPAVVDAEGTAVRVRFNGLPAKAKKDVPSGESGFFRLLDSEGKTVAEKLVGKVCL